MVEELLPACNPGGEQRNAGAEDVVPGAAGVTLRIDTTPRLRVRVTFRDRGQSKPVSIRLVRVAGGPSTERTFRDNAVDWRAALPGTWRVDAYARNVDATGAMTYTWVDVGTVTTGDPERQFDVLR